MKSHCVHNILWTLDRATFCINDDDDEEEEEEEEEGEEVSIGH